MRAGGAVGGEDELRHHLLGGPAGHPGDGLHDRVERGVGADEAAHQRLLPGEEAVHGRPRHRSAVGDAVHRGAGEAHLADHVGGRGEDPAGGVPVGLDVEQAQQVAARAHHPVDGGPRHPGGGGDLGE